MFGLFRIHNGYRKMWWLSFMTMHQRWSRVSQESQLLESTMLNRWESSWNGGTLATMARTRLTLANFWTRTREFMADVGYWDRVFRLSSRITNGISLLFMLKVSTQRPVTSIISTLLTRHLGVEDFHGTISNPLISERTNSLPKLQRF